MNNLIYNPFPFGIHLVKQHFILLIGSDTFVDEDGKDYRWLSTSEKVKAGLEVANLMARLTGLVYPTYIDNAECITTGIEPMYRQVIAAFARNTDLTATYPYKKNEPMKEAA